MLDQIILRNWLVLQGALETSGNRKRVVEGAERIAKTIETSHLEPCSYLIRKTRAQQEQRRLVGEAECGGGYIYGSGEVHGEIEN